MQATGEFCGFPCDEEGLGGIQLHNQSTKTVGQNIVDVAGQVLALCKHCSLCLLALKAELLQQQRPRLHLGLSKLSPTVSAEGRDEYGCFERQHGLRRFAGEQASHRNGDYGEANDDHCRNEASVWIGDRPDQCHSDHGDHHAAGRRGGESSGARHQCEWHQLESCVWCGQQDLDQPAEERDDTDERVADWLI